MVHLGLSYVSPPQPHKLSHGYDFLVPTKLEKKFKGFIGKELTRGPALWHGSFEAWRKGGSGNTGWTWMRDTGRVHQGAYMAPALAPVTAFPESLIRRKLEFGVTHFSLSATQHMICTKPGSSTETTKATARKSMALIENKLMLDIGQTGSGYLTTGQNQKNTTQNTKTH